MITLNFFQRNIWQMCKKQEIATVCKLKENKRWRHLFLKIGTLTDFERSTFGLPSYVEVFFK